MSKNEDRYHLLLVNIQNQYMRQWLDGYYASERGENFDTIEYDKTNPDYKAWLDGYHGFLEGHIKVRDEYEKSLESPQHHDKPQPPQDNIKNNKLRNSR